VNQSLQALLLAQRSDGTFAAVLLDMGAGAGCLLTVLKPCDGAQCIKLFPGRWLQAITKMPSRCCWATPALNALPLAFDVQQHALQQFLHPIAPADGPPHAMQARHAAWGFSSEDERAQ
jgi:hypothetical protein